MDGNASNTSEKVRVLEEKAQMVSYKILDIVYGIIAMFLGVRFLLRLLGASSAAPIVAWTLEISSRLMILFRGIFVDLFLGGGSVFDTSALVSLVFYTLIFFALKALVDVLFGTYDQEVIIERRHFSPHVHI